MARYRVSSSHAEDIASGGMFAPGEEAKGVDPKDPFDAAKIEAGVLVEITPPVKNKDDSEEGAK